MRCTVKTFIKKLSEIADKEGDLPIFIETRTFDEEPLESCWASFSNKKL